MGSPSWPSQQSTVDGKEKEGIIWAEQPWIQLKMQKWFKQIKWLLLNYEVLKQSHVPTQTINECMYSTILCIKVSIQKYSKQIFK